MNSFRSYLTKFAYVMFALFVALLVSQHPRAMADTTTTSLTGTDWQLVSLGTPENLSEPIAGLGGRTLSAQFTEDRVGGSGGCNTYGATYQTNDSKLSISSLISTKIACTSEIDRQESRYFAALAGAQRYQLTPEGRLKISYETPTENGVLIFANRNTSTVNLALTSWKLVSLGTPGNLSEPIIGFGGRTLTAEFTEDRVEGSGGCNGYSATYQTIGNVLLLNQESFVSTLIGCSEEIDSQEQRYFAALVGAQSYLLNEYGQLEISYQTETESGVLVFEPQ